MGIPFYGMILDVLPFFVIGLVAGKIVSAIFYSAVAKAEKKKFMKGNLL
jgi:hypothetical protein